MTRFWQMFVKLVDLKSGLMKSTEAIVKEGDWQFSQIDKYTSASPLVVNAGSTTKLSFDAEDVSFTAGRGEVVAYNYTAQKFLTTTVDDVYMLEVRFKCKSSTQNGHGALKIECPTVAYNPIQANSLSVPLTANSEQFYSFSAPVFIGQDLVTNGLEIKWQSVAGNFSIYDVSFMFIRVSSGK